VEGAEEGGEGADEMEQMTVSPLDLVMAQDVEEVEEKEEERRRGGKEEDEARTTTRRRRRRRGRSIFIFCSFASFLDVTAANDGGGGDG